VQQTFLFRDDLCSECLLDPLIQRLSEYETHRKCEALRGHDLFPEGLSIPAGMSVKPQLQGQLPTSCRDNTSIDHAGILHLSNNFVEKRSTSNFAQKFQNANSIPKSRNFLKYFWSLDTCPRILIINVATLKARSQASCAMR
jgi:hypothetical protein